MIRDRYNIIPVFLAAIFHVAVFTGLVVAFDFTKPAHPAVPLAITASLLTEADLPPPPAPEPEPEPEPDNSEQERIRLEEEKRQADLRAEQERIRLQEEADRERREREAEERKRRQEEEVERRRAEAERKRQEDLERQLLENQRLRREAEEAELERRRQEELQAEEMRLAALNASDKDRWAFAIKRHIERYFVPPASVPDVLECTVDVRQLPGGQVVSVDIGPCNGDEPVRRAIESAIFRASPLPEPENPAIFERDLRLTINIEQ